MRYPILFSLCFALSACGPVADVVERTKLDEIATAYQQGESDQAVSDLEAFLVTYPKNDLGWTILGNAYLDMDAIEKAATAYDTALAINPDRFQALTGQGIIARQNGDYDKAISAYNRALEVDPTYAQAHSSLAVIYLKRGADDKALEHAQKAYALDKEDATIAANLAVAYHYKEDFSNRDALKEHAANLGYSSMDNLEKIFNGELTVRD